jgi:hypothetical protein
MSLIKEQKFKDFLKDKRVVVVGPSKTIENSNNGELIDSYDLVVRLNRALSHLDKDSKDIGSRTDILYACLSTGQVGQPHPKTGRVEVDAKAFEESGVKIISCCFPREVNFFNTIQPNINYLLENTNIDIRIPPAEAYMKLQTEVDCHLNSGFAGVCDLLETDLKELKLIGVDFHRTTYMSEYEDFTWESLCDMHKNHSQHDPDKQFKYFKYQIYNKDKRVKADEPLKHFLSDPKYENTL